MGSQVRFLLAAPYTKSTIEIFTTEHDSQTSALILLGKDNYVKALEFKLPTQTSALFYLFYLGNENADLALQFKKYSQVEALRTLGGLFMKLANAETALKFTEDYQVMALKGLGRAHADQALNVKCYEQAYAIRYDNATFEDAMKIECPNHNSEVSGDSSLLHSEL